MRPRTNLGRIWGLNVLFPVGPPNLGKSEMAPHLAPQKKREYRKLGEASRSEMRDYLMLKQSVIRDYIHAMRCQETP